MVLSLNCRASQRWRCRLRQPRQRTTPVGKAKAFVVELSCDTSNPTQELQKHMDILTLLDTLAPALSSTASHQLYVIVLALLAISGRVTMLGLARWSGPGGSYRTIQRFFATALPWPLLTWLFVRQHLLQPDDVYLLAGDEVVVTKAGKKTHGLDYFFSSIYQKTLPSVAFFSLALLSTKTRRAFPLRLEQVERTEEEQAARQARAAAKKAKRAAAKRQPGRPKSATNPAPAAPAAPTPDPPTAKRPPGRSKGATNLAPAAPAAPAPDPPTAKRPPGRPKSATNLAPAAPATPAPDPAPAKRKPGRPKGSTNQPKVAPAAPAPDPPSAKRKPGRPKGSTNQPKTPSLSPELQRIQTMVQAQLQLIAGVLALVYLVLDGHFGNSPSLQMVLGCGLQLISKLRFDAALYFPYAGPYAGRGPHRKYGDKLNVAAIPAKYLVQSTVEAAVETSIYQVELLQKEFSQALNVVIIVKTNQQTQAQGHVILFSSDLGLGYEKLIEYYSLRFQIEFTFRDAKQYWGLEDFMNVTATGVSNAANLALFMVNVSAVLLREARRRDAACSVLDLKAYYRGYKYVAETIKMLPGKPEEDLIRRIYQRVASLGRIHAAESLPNAA
jgi:putative transposase